MPRRRKGISLAILRKGRLFQGRKILKRRRKKMVKRLMKIHRRKGKAALREFQDFILTNLSHLQNRLRLKKPISILQEFRPDDDISTTLRQSFPLKMRKLKKKI